MSQSSSRVGRGVNAVNRALLQELIPALVPCLKASLENGINRELADFKRVWLETLMQSEVNELTGKPYERNRKPSTRWGYEKGIAIVDGGKIEIIRPRIRLVRTLKGGEIQLETYKAMNRSDLLDGPLRKAILAGVSTRAYSQLICQNLAAKGIKRSSVSRRFIEATKPIVEAFLKRDLSKLELIVLFIDGVHIGGMSAIANIGVDTQGRKTHPWDAVGVN
jgi:putative transposase